MVYSEVLHFWGWVQKTSALIGFDITDLVHRYLDFMASKTISLKLGEYNPLCHLGMVNGCKWLIKSSIRLATWKQAWIHLCRGMYDQHILYPDTLYMEYPPTSIMNLSQM